MATVIYLRFIKNTYFHVVKQKIVNSCIDFFQARKLLQSIKLNLSENLTFQNLLKNRKPLPAEKLGKILVFEKEFKRKQLLHISRQFY